MPAAPARPADRKPADPDAEGPTPHTEAMATALGAILNQVPDARAALPLMAALEKSLREKGLRAITSTSVETMARVAAQLDALPVAVDDAPMHALKLHVIERLEPPAAPAVGLRSDFGPGAALEVGTASMSAFMAASHAMSDFVAGQHALAPRDEAGPGKPAR